MSLEDALTASPIHTALAQIAEDTFWLVRRMPQGEVLLQGRCSTQTLERVLEMPDGIPLEMYTHLGPIWHPYAGGPITKPGVGDA
jgi:hypothetical protein